MRASLPVPSRATVGVTVGLIPCPNCGNKVNPDAAGCQNCGANPQTGVVPERIFVTAQGAGPQTSQTAETKAGSGGAMMIGGAALAVGGLLVTLITYGAARENGGTYFIAYGPVIFGAIMFFGGLGKAVTGKAKAKVQEHPDCAVEERTGESAAPPPVPDGEEDGAPDHGPVSPFDWLSPEERRWLVEGIADTRTERTLPLLLMLAEDEDSAVARDAARAAARVRADPGDPSSAAKAGRLPVDEAAQSLRGRRRKHQLESLGRCIGNPTEHNVSVLQLLSAGADDPARHAGKALELLALWSETAPAPSPVVGEMPSMAPLAGEEADAAGGPQQADPVRRLDTFCPSCGTHVSDVFCPSCGRAQRQAS